MRASARPITPRPIFRVDRVCSRISGTSIGIDINHCVQELNAKPDNGREQFFIQLTIPDTSGKVDAPEVAAFIRQERLFPAGIGRLDRP